VRVCETYARCVHVTKTEAVARVGMAGPQFHQEALASRDVGIESPASFHSDKTRCLQEGDVNDLTVKDSQSILDLDRTRRLASHDGVPREFPLMRGARKVLNHNRGSHLG
jgi:hypothetical protein